MDREEYEGWINYVSTNGRKIQKLFVEDYNNWNSKVLLARYLSLEGCEQYEPALRLMKGVLTENLTEFNKDEDISYKDYVEQKIMVLRDIGWLYWKIEKDAVKALSYMNESLILAESVDNRFVFVVRGEIWRERLNYLLKVYGEKIVLQEIKDKIQSYESIDIPKANSYLFNAYHILGDMSKKKGHHEKAINYLKKALFYFPLEDREKRKLTQIWSQRKKNIIEAYDNMESLAKMIVCWAI